MNSKVLAAITAAGLLSVSQVNALSAVDEDLPAYTKTSGVSGNLTSVGSDTLANLMTLWAESFKNTYPSVNVQIQAAGSSTAPPALTENTANLGSLNMLTISKADTPRVFTGTIKPDRKSEIYALCGWFSSSLCQGVTFGTGPNDIPTHWDQVLFPLPEPFTVDPSRELTLCISPLTELTGKEQYWSWSITDGDKTLSVNEQQLQLRSLTDVPQGKL